MMSRADRRVPLASSWLFLSLVSCAPPHAPTLPAPPPAPVVSDAANPALDAFVDANRARYTAAIAGARAFLDALDVDPAALRARHLKGKKKLVEALDAYYRLYQVSPPGARAGLLARIAALAKPTTEAGYHDMLTVDDHAFNEDATSYLRAALLLDRMGLDTALYRRAIEAVKGRLDAHMKERGPHQRRAFHTYYQHFGLAEPFPLAGALEQGLIARRADPAQLGRMDAYALTHEVFTAYAFGDDLDARPFTGEDRAYLRGALGALGDRSLRERDPDLVAEIVTCLRLLRMTDAPGYTRGIAYLLDAQNADGAWGSYEPLRARLGDLVKQAFYLHTTMVAIDALTLAFEPMFRRGEGAP
jgi:hypothetical protein